MIIRKVGLRSLANVVGSVYVVLGLIAGAALTIAGLAGLAPSDLDGIERAVFSPIAIFVLPIVSGIKGYIIGALAAWVFNRVAPATGGLEIEVEPGGELGPVSAAA